MQILQESTCAKVSFLIKLQAWSTTLLKKNLAQVLSCEFCEISKNTFFNRTPLGDCFCTLEIFSVYLKNYKEAAAYIKSTKKLPWKIF